MKSALSVVLERNTVVAGVLETEPYEAGWATEAIWFVETLDPLECRWTLRVQISPDGLRWCDWEPKLHDLAPHGLTAVTVERFGTWVRIVLEPVDNPGARARLMITLALK